MASRVASGVVAGPASSRRRRRTSSGDAAVGAKRPKQDQQDVATPTTKEVVVELRPHHHLRRVPGEWEDDWQHIKAAIIKALVTKKVNVFDNDIVTSEEPVSDPEQRVELSQDELGTVINILEESIGIRHDNLEYYGSFRFTRDAAGNVASIHELLYFVGSASFKKVETRKLMERVLHDGDVVIVHLDLDASPKTDDDPAFSVIVQTKEMVERGIQRWLHDKTLDVGAPDNWDESEGDEDEEEGDEEAAALRKSARVAGPNLFRLRTEAPDYDWDHDTSDQLGQFCLLGQVVYG